MHKKSCIIDSVYAYDHDTSFLQKRGKFIFAMLLSSSKRGKAKVKAEGGKDGIFRKGTFAQEKGNLQK